MCTDHVFILFKHVVAEPLDAVDHGHGGCCVDHRRRSDWEASAFRFRLVGTIDEEAPLMMSVVMRNIFEVREVHNGNGQAVEFKVRPRNSDSCGRCCRMVVGLVKSGNGKPVVKFVFEDCIRQKISADANVATFMFDWRVSICWSGERRDVWEWCSAEAMVVLCIFRNRVRLDLFFWRDGW